MTPCDELPPAMAELVQRASCPASWKVLPNGRLGMALPSQKGIKQTFLAMDGKTRLCPHGMTASAISSWKKSEVCSSKKCDCPNLDGLTASRREDVPRGWQTPPVDYFDVLGCNNAKEITVHGNRIARELLHTTSSGTPLYMLCSGQVRCAHGNSETTLRAFGKQKYTARRRACSCGVGKLSWRQLRFQNQLGKRRF